MPNKSSPLTNMEDKKLVSHRCKTCNKLYWVFRDEASKDEPIEKCCACRDPVQPHIETYQTAAMSRLR